MLRSLATRVWSGLSRAALLVLVCFAWSGRGANAQERFVIPIAEDTLLYIENRGATRILVELNEVPFKLTSDPAEAERSVGAYLIPAFGVITIDIAPYMVPGDNANIIDFLSQGPPGSDYDFVLAPVFVEGQTSAAYRLSGLEVHPDKFRLRASPNPARGPVKVTYEIPAARITGLAVRLSVFDSVGRRVAVLVDDTRFPGAYSVRWDWSSDGSVLPAGVFAFRFETDVGVETTRVSHVR